MIAIRDASQNCNGILYTFESPLVELNGITISTKFLFDPGEVVNNLMPLILLVSKFQVILRLLNLAFID